MTNELVLSMAALVAAAVTAALVARAFRVPAVPFYILAGYGLAHVPQGARTDTLGDLLLLCIAFLLFVGGLALNPSRFPRDRVPLYIALALVEVAVVGGLAFALTTFAGWSLLESLYGAFAAAFSSTLLVTSVLAAQHRLGHLAGRLSLGLLLVQDALAILLIALVPVLQDAAALTPAGAALAHGRTLGAVALMAALTWVLMRWVLPRMLQALHRDPEDRTLVAIGLVFLSLLGAATLGLPVVMGPFFAGVALSPYPANLHVRSFARSVRQFFVPLFFVTLGIFLSPLTAADLPLFAGLLLLVIVVKPLVLAVTAALAGFTTRTSTETGLLSAQGSEFALALALAGLADGTLSLPHLAILGTVIAVSMALSPFLPVDRLSGIASRTFPRPVQVHADRLPERGHVVILGGGGLGRALAEGYRARGRPLVVVDHDIQVVEALRDEFPVLRGEGAHPSVLARAHAGGAARVYAVMGKAEENLEVVRALGPGRVVARVRTPEEHAEAERLGAEPLYYPSVVGEAFLEGMEEAGDVPRAPEGARERPRED